MQDDEVGGVGEDDDAEEARDPMDVDGDEEDEPAEGEKPGKREVSSDDSDDVPVVSQCPRFRF